MCVYLVDAADKKRKRDQRSKGTEGAEEREVTHSSHQPPTKEVRTSRGLQKKSTSIGTSKEAEGDCLPKPSVWRPIFTLSSSNPVLSDANLRDHQKGSSSLIVEWLEKAL